jgi:hypothetical protein
MTGDDRHRPVEAARVRAELTVQELWLRYVALGGASDAFDVDGYLQGLVPLDTFQQDMLAQAVNEELEEVLREMRVPLSIAAQDSDVGKLLDGIVADLRERTAEWTDRGRDVAGEE